MISAYIIRNIVAIIPFPLDGYFGFKHNQVSEINGGVIISFAVIVLQPMFSRKVTYLIHDRLQVHSIHY